MSNHFGLNKREEAYSQLEPDSHEEEKSPEDTTVKDQELDLPPKGEFSEDTTVKDQESDLPPKGESPEDTTVKDQELEPDSHEEEKSPEDTTVKDQKDEEARQKTAALKESKQKTKEAYEIINRQQQQINNFEAERLKAAPSVDNKIDLNDLAEDDPVRKVIESQNEKIIQLQNFAENQKTKTAVDLKSDKKKQEQDVYDGMIAQADEELAAEGYAGFKSVGVPFVEKEINKIGKFNSVSMQYDDVEAAKSAFTVEGFKKLYKDKIYPEKSKIFLNADKNSILRNKIELKKKANLVKKSGISLKNVKTEPLGDSVESYVKDRRANRFKKA